MSDSDYEEDLNERATRGLTMLTEYLERDTQAEGFDESAIRALLKDRVSDDDSLTLALVDMLMAAEMVMLNYQARTDIRAVEVVREIALLRQTRLDTADG